jgi:hypothetical protein
MSGAIKIDEKRYQEDFERIRLWLSHARSQVPFAIAYTLTLMGKAGKEEMARRLPSYFDRPTRWTLNSILLTAATKQSQRSEVFIKDGSRAHLLHHITGEGRPEKGYEYMLRQKGILRGSNQYTTPAKRLKLDAYGNIGMARINRIMSSVGAQLDPNQNTTAASTKRNASRNPYVVIRKQDRPQLASGIYEVTTGGARLQPALIFVKKTSYKRKLPFFEVVEDAAYDAMPAAVDTAINRVMFGKR